MTISWDEVVSKGTGLPEAGGPGSTPGHFPKEPEPQNLNAAITEP
jgi:hypothetical protein